MNEKVIYVFFAGLIIVILAVTFLIINLFKDDLLNIEKVAHFKRRNKMSNKEKVKALIIGILLILAIVGAERIYNNSDRFQVVAEDASHYDFIEAKVAPNYKLEDLDYLYSVLDQHYPFFKVNERITGKTWLDNKRAYKRLIKNTKNDAEFFIAMERILGDLNDSNLEILSGHDFKWNYKNIYRNLEANDNLNTMGFYGTLRSPHVMYRYQFDGVEDVILYGEDNLQTHIIVPSEIAYMKVKAMAGFEVGESDYRKMINFLKEVEDYDKLIIDIRGNQGGEDDYWETLVELLTDRPLEATYYSFFKDGHRVDRDPYKVEGARTIQELDEVVLNQFPEEIKTDFSFYKLQNIAILPTEDVQFKGKIYLLVDGDVNSQGENFAAFAQDTNFATLVGETTGGNSVFEDVPIAFLRNSKFAFSYSRELVINADGTINQETKTTPDIEIDATIGSDYNEDKAIQAAIAD